MNRPTSPLARFASLMQETDESHARAAAAAAWKEGGIVLINPEWLRSWADQQQLIILAEKMYGKRRVAPK